jgi:hypothetical protein
LTAAADLTASLARLEEWARHSEALAMKAEADRAEMITKLHKLSEVQNKLVEDMEKVKPVTDMVTSVKAIVTGATIVLGMIGALFWAGLHYFQEAIVKWITG